MLNNSLCDKCLNQESCDIECQAIMALSKLCREEDRTAKAEMVKFFCKDLGLIDYEVADDLRELGERVIAAMPELHIIPDFNVKVGFVRSYERKKDKGKIIAADCRKVTGTYTAYLPFDFIVTFYEPNMYYMTENQQKILMLHELKHIGMGEKGLRIEYHDVEDFRSILNRYGIEWNDFNQDVPDILAGELDGKEKDEGKTKGRNRQEVATKRPAGKNGRTSAKSRGSEN